MTYALILVLFINGSIIEQVEFIDFNNQSACIEYAIDISETFIDTGFVQQVEASCIDTMLRVI